jgi:hypothetical protein
MSPSLDALGEAGDVRARCAHALQRAPPSWTLLSRGFSSAAVRAPVVAVCAPRALPATRFLSQTAAAAATSDVDADADANAEAPADADALPTGNTWSRFLAHLHAGGYFAAEAGAGEDGAVSSSAAAAAAAKPAPNAKGLVPRYGSPGDHKRAVLAYARERERALRALPSRALRALAAAAVPQEALDGIFGGRKTINAVKRLRVALALTARDVAPGCAAARNANLAQGDASLPDAARLLLTFATTRMPAGAAPADGALDELLEALMTMPRDAVSPSAAAGEAPASPGSAFARSDAAGARAAPAQQSPRRSSDLAFVSAQRRAADATIEALTSAQVSAASERAFDRKRTERRRPMRRLLDDADVFADAPGAPPPRPARASFSASSSSASAPPPRMRSSLPAERATSLPPLERRFQSSPPPPRRSGAFAESYLEQLPTDDDGEQAAAAAPAPRRSAFPSERSSTERTFGRSAERPPRAAPPPVERVRSFARDGRDSRGDGERERRPARAAVPAAAVPPRPRWAQDGEGSWGGGGGASPPPPPPPRGERSAADEGTGLWSGLPR